MFPTNKDYYSVHPSYINRPVPLYCHSGSNKENLNPFSLKKISNPPLSEPELHSHNDKQKSLQQIAQFRPFEPSQASYSATQASEELNMTAKKSSGTRESISRCEHKNTKSYKKNYCKDCGVFLSKNGAETYVERCFNEKMDSHPDEVYKIMLENQHKNRQYKKDPCHIKGRKILIEWMCEIAEGLKLFTDTVYTAISYLDTIVTKFEIPDKKLQLVSLCCLMIAGKFCEKEDKLPSYKDFVEFCKGVYPVELFKKTETLILETLDWNIKTVTPFQFIQFYLSKGCVFSTDRSMIRNIDSKLLRYLRKYSEFFNDISLRNYDFNAYNSNLIACSAICGARKAVGLHPIWSPEMQELTDVSWRDIESCYNTLYSSFEIAFPEIASKANSYAIKAQKSGVNELEQSYAAMSIENRTGTPLNRKTWRGQNNVEDNTSSQKEKEPTPAIREKGNGIRMIDWALPRRKAERSEETFIINTGIKLFKKVDENEMNIENICEEFIERDSLSNNVKRNLVF